MFNHFRKHYPQGNLISQFVSIEDGQYIVQVMATVDSTPFANSYAAAPTLEQAEDIARARLLAFLDIPLPEMTFTPQKAPETPLKANIPSTPPSPEPPVSSPTPPPEPEPAIQPPTPEPEPEPITAFADKNFDFDAAIKQTDAELKRLGWNKKQGRDYLQKTYGEDKIARKDLSAEELTSFLEYLQQQPSPDNNPSPPEPTVPESPAVATVSSPPASPPTEAAMDPSFDFPGIMAQINIQKKRLGWTKDQEIDYLLQTHGRRSRQYLTDQQLAEYLDYLRGLPS